MRISLNDLDYSIRMHIEQALIAEGLYPDEGNPSLTDAQLRAEIEALRTAGTYCIAKGVGNYVDREQITDASIIVNRGNVSPNEGSNTANLELCVSENETNTDNFDVSRLPERTKMVSYDIRLITKDVLLSTRIYDVMQQALGERGFIGKFEYGTRNLSEDSFYMELLGQVDLSNNLYIEVLYSYRVMDVIIDKVELVNENFEGLSNTTLQIEPTTDI